MFYASYKFDSSIKSKHERNQKKLEKRKLQFYNNPKKIKK